jgi:hypothetical protein
MGLRDTDFAERLRVAFMAFKQQAIYALCKCGILLANFHDLPPPLIELVLHRWNTLQKIVGTNSTRNGTGPAADNYWTHGDDKPWIGRESVLST